MRKRPYGTPAVEYDFSPSNSLGPTGGAGQGSGVGRAAMAGVRAGTEKAGRRLKEFPPKRRRPS